jgi:F-type H+-transporting ATPase subunit alpha
MSEIRPSEVIALIRQEIAGLDLESNLEEIGSVLQVGDGIARVYGLGKVQSGEMVEFIKSGIKGIVLNLEIDNVGIVVLGEISEIKEGDKVKRLNKIASIMAGEGLLGRVINTLGEPLDGKGPIEGELYEMPLERIAPGVIFREPVNVPLQTGIKAIDAMIPIGRGQRELIIGDRQTGKTAIVIDTIINQRENYEKGKPVFCIYVSVGQKSSSVAQTVKILEDKGAMPYTVLTLKILYSALAGFPSINTTQEDTGYAPCILELSKHSIRFGRVGNCKSILTFSNN